MVHNIRARLLDEQDRVYEQYDGKTPDHIIFSKEIYTELSRASRFEPLRNPDYRPEGYLGMTVWYSEAVGNHDLDAILLSEAVFQQIVPRAKDFK